MKIFIRRRASLIIFFVLLLVWAVQTKTIHESWNESSRLAAIQSVVEFGTWRIDRSPYAHETGDRWLSPDGHYYSDKPPLFAALGAIPYALMYHGLGIRLNPEGCLPGQVCAYKWLTVLLVGLPSAMMAALFYRLAFHQTRSVWWVVALTALLCFGTVVWPYSLVFNHHLPAAAALFIAFYLLYRPTGQPWRIGLAGLLAGTATMLDLTAVFVAVALAGIVWLYHRSHLFHFLVAAVVPGLATVGLNYQITGGPLFPYFTGQGYNYPGSPFDVTVAAQHPPQNIGLYAFRSLLGDQGIFWFSPLLFFAGAGAARAALNAGRVWLLLLAGIAGQMLFVLLRTNNFGGDAYGGRFYIPIIPLLFTGIVFVVPALFRGRGGSVWGGLFVMAAVTSVFAAYQGVQVTWHRFNPPVYLTLQPGVPYVAWRANLVLPAYRPPDRSQIQARNFDIPTGIQYRLDASFGGDVTLLGYNLPARRVEPGQPLDITLYWQSQRVPPADDFAFVNLLDSAQNRVAGSEGLLLETYPLRYWFPGEVVTGTRRLAIPPDTAPGPYWLSVGLYRIVEEQAEPLPVIDPQTGQPTGQTSITIGPIKVGGPPPGVTVTQAEPEHAVNATFGDQITLQGYDMSISNPQSPISNLQSSIVNLKLYWQALRPPDADYTLFVHIRNAAGEVVAQRDQPVAGGQYPSSLWEPGEQVFDRVEIPLPDDLPPGRYEVVVGLYELATGQRLAVPGSAGNSLSLAEFVAE